MNPVIRSPLQVTYSTWKALFLREAVNRLSAGRAAWLWILLEPVLHIAYMLIIFIVVRARSIGGVDTTIWLMVGMLAFFTFRRTAQQAMNAVDANKALFAYRQVRPVDTVLVRAGVEGFLMIIVTIILFAGVALLDHDVLPADPIAVFEAVFGLWLIGIGFGLVTSVVTQLVQEAGRVIGIILRPLYFISGVIIPISSVPQPYREWLLYNPLVHGLEAARLGFAPYYHAVLGLNIGYLYGFALVILFLGLAMHICFAKELVAR